MRKAAVLAGVAGAGAASAIAVTVMRRGQEDGGAEHRTGELQQHLGDMLALDREILGAMKRQLEDPELGLYSAARQVVEQVQDTLQRHVQGLEDELELLGGGPSTPVKSAAAAVAGVAAGLFERVRTTPVSRMLRDDYAALSLVSISYTMLHTAAMSLHEQRVAEMSQHYLRDVTPLVTRLNEAIPPVVVEELSREVASVDAGAGRAAVQHSHEAWAEASRQDGGSA